MKKIIALIIAAGLSIPVLSQDIHFSQINETPLHLNPAYTGFFDGLYRVSLHHRNQWASMGNPYQTSAAAIDGNIGIGPGALLGIGGFFYKDQAGDSKFGTFQGSLSISGIVSLDDYSKLSAGLQGGYSQRSATIADLKWESQYVNGTYDPNAPVNESNLLTSFPYADFSAGIGYQFRNVAGNIAGKDVFEVNAGLAAFHANRPEMKFHQGSGDRLDMRIVTHANVRWDIPDSKWSIRPSAYYMKQGVAKEIVAGAMFRFRIKNGTKITNFFSESGIAMGAHYRFGDAIIPQLYYDLGDFFIGLSYDVNISKYNLASKYKGGYEITIRYANLNSALYKNRKR
ncbi:MAG: hypothetical protein Fur0041_17820 [Bacteroidia bacterium]